MNLLDSRTLKELDVSLILQSKQRGHLKYKKNNQVLKVAQMFYSTDRNTNSETISQKIIILYCTNLHKGLLLLFHIPHIVLTFHNESPPPNYFISMAGD